MIPGPGVVSIVGYALGSGRKTALASVAGMATGNAVAMSLSLFGVGALLAASALAFSTVKWMGALYLIVLGVITIVKIRVISEDQEIQPSRPISARVAFTSNVAIGVFHPKTIVFFVAFVPQFINSAKSYLPQAALLVLTFCFIVAGTDTAYALAASRVANLLHQRRIFLWSKRAGGGVLIAAGLATAAAHS